MGKCYLKIRYHKRGLCLKKDCLENVTVEHREYYKGGCILTFSWGGGVI